MLRASEAPKRSYTGEELSRDEEGFVVFKKRDIGETLFRFKVAVNVRGEVDPAKIIAWEIYKYKEMISINFYADKPGIFIALFGPAEGSLITLKSYELKKYIPNMVRIKVEGASNQEVQARILSLEADDAVIYNIGDYIAIKVISYK